MAWRVQIFFLRFLDYLFHIPLRIWRFLKFLFYFPFRGKHKFLRWLTGSFLLMVDITPVPFLLESILDWVKIKTRPLNGREIELAHSVFGSAIPLRLIGADPYSIPARKKMTVAFTSLHTINFNGTIPEQTFIHELVHIWQYRKYGSVYISESLWAQRWGGGYDYGGFDSLKLHYPAGLSSFNFEQQADIVEDYFRLKNKLHLQWTLHDPQVEPLLDYYANQVKGTV